MHKPIGALSLSSILKSNRDSKLRDIKTNQFVTIDANMDKEMVAFEFERFDLVSAPVTDDDGRLIGVITADDIVDVIQEEAEEDIKLLGGVGDENITDNPIKSSRGRFSWLFINLLTAVLASLVIGLFDATIKEMVALAILMPIVASMGGNAGTQTVTVAVRALATRQLNYTNLQKFVLKETWVGLLNGLLFALLSALLAYLWFDKFKNFFNHLHYKLI